MCVQCLTGALRNLGKTGSQDFFCAVSSCEGPWSYPLLTLHLTKHFSPPWKKKRNASITIESLQFCTLGLSDMFFLLPEMPHSGSGYITLSLHVSAYTLLLQKGLPHLSYLLCVLLSKRVFYFIVSFTTMVCNDRFSYVVIDLMSVFSDRRWAPWRQRPGWFGWPHSQHIPQGPAHSRHSVEPGSQRTAVGPMAISCVIY